MSAQDITLKNELYEDWQLLHPIISMTVLALAAVGLYIVTRNIIQMYKETKK